VLDTQTAKVLDAMPKSARCFSGLMDVKRFRAGRTGSAPAAGVQFQPLGFEARTEVAIVRDRDHRTWAA
jgi:hypothetical protein